jgi:hypothetical protein
MSTGDPTSAIQAAVLADPCVRSLELMGSRALGTATDLSDWDYRVTSEDPAGTARRLPDLLATLDPLGSLWDPLASEPVYMIVLPGAVKADLFPGLPARLAPDPPLEASEATLPAIDAHFWDWNLWLGAKRLRGLDALAGAELAKMWHYLLRPLGSARPPVSQHQAVTSYLQLRGRQEQRLGFAVPRELGDAVIGRLRGTGLLPEESHRGP